MKQAFLPLLMITLPLWAQEYSPPLNAPQQNQLYWGDLHVHSNFSPDSFAFGNSRLGPDDAFTFAKGARVTANNGMDVRLRKPLDFLLVADHAEFLGVFPKLLQGDPAFLRTDLGARWQQTLQDTGNVGSIVTEWVALLQDPDYVQELSAEFRNGIWKEAAGAAERHNNPGVFTAFVGYEWTSMIGGNNLHRVVLYRDGADSATSFPPFSALDSQDPEILWQALARYEAATGGRVMSIPHNGNVSNGLMFAAQTLSGEPLDKAYTEARSRWEPIYEVTQVKGDGETHPFLSPDDEFADFETWDDDNIARSAAKQNDMLQYEYARSALKLGLEFEAKLGANPYEFGMIGSTDSHTALSTADDDNFWGKFLDSEPSADRATRQMGGMLWYNWKLAASGYAAIWARENTREALFDALQRKEVYATTGPRIALRFFGGWQFEAGDEYAPDIASRGYTRGVPMGGHLAEREGGGAPRFLLHALKDPDGANLDRAQIVKGWINAAGVAQERVYDVGLSDGRTLNPATGKAARVPSTVDIKAASYSNAVGAVSLGTVWEDPDFDPRQPAFYYVRVIEIPTPRWTAYDAKYFKQDRLEGVSMITQERVYSSPIWYRP